jgi:hypothetical protein
MKAKIIENGFYDSYTGRKFVSLDSERDVLIYSRALKEEKKVLFKVKRGFPWNDSYFMQVALSFDEYKALNS